MVRNERETGTCLWTGRQEGLAGTLAEEVTLIKFLSSHHPQEHFASLVFSDSAGRC